MLADALVAAGDPRGEFIQLQTALEDGRGTPAMIARANQLLTEHGKRWREPFGDARVELRAGFPYRVAAHAIDPARPEWATVEELDYTGEAELAPLLARMPLLRVLIVRKRVAAKLAERGPFPGIRTLGGGGWWPTERRAFPDLAVLAGRWLDHDQAQLATRALGLDAIVHYCLPHVPDHIAKVVGARSLGPPETRCAIASSDGGFARHGWYVRSWRDRDDVEVGFRDSDWFETQTMSRVIEPLIAIGIRTIALAIPFRHRAQAMAALQRTGVEIGEASPSDVLAPATVGG